MIDLGLVVGERAVFGDPCPQVLDRIPAELRDVYVDVCTERVSELEAVTVARGAFAGGPPPSDGLAHYQAAVRRLCGTGRERQALLLARLLVAAVEGAGAVTGEEPYEIAADTFVRAGGLVLHSLLVKPLYDAVVSLAEDVLARARDQGDRQRLHDALERAAEARACLTLEGFNLATWADESMWRASLRGRIDAAVLESPNLDVLRMPEILPELHRREQLLLELLSLGGEHRGRSLTALVHVSGVLGQRSRVSAEERIALAREAAAEPDSRLEALRLLDQFGAIGEDDRKRPVYEGSLTDMHTNAGSLMAILVYRSAAWIAMRIGRHDEARRLTEEYLRLPVEDAPEEQWLQALDVAVHCNDLGSVCCEAAQAHGDDAGALLRLIPRRLGPDDAHAAHLHAALHAAGLEVADAVLERRGHVVRDRDGASVLRMVRYVRATVALRTAIGGVGPRAAPPEPRLRAGVEALRLHAELGAVVRAGLCAETIARLLSVHRGLAEEAVRALLPVLDRALSVLGPEADDRIAALGDVLAHPIKAVSSDVTPSVAFYHSQLFKGLRSAKVVRHSGPFPATAEDLGADEEILRQEAAVAAQTPPAEAPLQVAPELLTLLYATGTERLGGATVGERLRNLRFTAETSVRARLYRQRMRLDIRRHSAAEAVSGTPRPSRRLISFDELRAVLGMGTVLVDLFDAAREGGNYGFYISAYNASHSFSEDAYIADIAPGFAMVDQRHPGRVLRGASSAHFVAALRRRILEDPGRRRPIVREGAEMLRQYPIFALNHEKALPLYRERGARHVCLWPHGALQYAPLHLFDLDGRPLADDWTVTSLASAASLMHRRPWSDEQPRPERTVSVLAASSPDGGLAAGYPSLPELVRQAEAVAATAAGSVLLEPGDATPAAILATLPHCRYAHLAAHGNADVYAPSFQALHFTGEAGRGRLTARQLMRADLRNVDLVTLAACESGLGRFDRLDNHMGLAAALLGAGVTAVVSCLWQVRPAPAALFFVRLYEVLAATNGELRVAFRAAQLATRNVFPAYRDWGSFVYSGGW